jgi:phage terminase large subunit
MTAETLFASAAAKAGCPTDQLLNLVRAECWLQERQLVASAAARLCDRADGPTAIGYGGARGGGKSHWLLAQMGADDCQRVAGLKCLLLRKVGKANLEHFEDLRRKLFGRLPHEFSAFRGILAFSNGSRIIAGHFQNEKDIDAYLGLEYDVIGIEEATTLTARKYQDITTCCRTSKPNWRPRIYSTTNPGGVGHGWYRKRFIEPWQRRAETETRFIAARVTDNRWNNPEYVRVLENLGGWQKRAWLDGDWDIAAGQFFTSFRRDVHVIEDFDDTRAREWFAALDYGYAHYTVCLLGCRDGDGNTFIVDEHAARLWLPQRHAAAISAMVGRHLLNGFAAMRGRLRLSLRSDAEVRTRPLALADLKRFVAGADVFSRQSDGTTIAQQYAKHGISLGCANTDRVNGWAEILQGFGEPQCGLPPGSAPANGPMGSAPAEGNRHADAVRPTLFIHERCARLIETLPALQHDPHRPEDVLKVDMDDDGNGGDDAADALRYLVATKSRAVTQRKLRGL